MSVPIRGVLVGGDEHALGVAVDVVALGEMDVHEGNGASASPEPGTEATGCD